MGKIYHHTEPSPAFTELGGYPIVHLVVGDGTGGVRTFWSCARCATVARHTQQDPHWRPLVRVESHVHYEGEPIECESGEAADCMGEVESAYGPAEDDGA